METWIVFFLDLVTFPIHISTFFVLFCRQLPHMSAYLISGPRVLTFALKYICLWIKLFPKFAISYKRRFCRKTNFLRQHNSHFQICISAYWDSSLTRSPIRFDNIRQLRSGAYFLNLSKHFLFRWTSDHFFRWNKSHSQYDIFTTCISKKSRRGRAQEEKGIAASKRRSGWTKRSELLWPWQQ